MVSRALVVSLYTCYVIPKTYDTKGSQDEGIGEVKKEGLEKRMWTRRRNREGGERRKIRKENVTYVRARSRNVEEEGRGEGLDKSM